LQTNFEATGWNQFHWIWRKPPLTVFGQRWRIGPATDPFISIWFDKFLDGVPHFWFGFESDQERIIKQLVDEASRFDEFKRPVKVTNNDLNDEAPWRLLKAKVTELKENGGLSHEQYRGEAYAFGKYDLEFNSTSAQNLAKDAARFVGGVIEHVGRSLGAQDEVARLKQLGTIARRPEQLDFSRKLREAYNGKCAVTGCATGEALEAAHIKVKKGFDDNHPIRGRGTADADSPASSVPPIQQARWRRCDASFRLPATMAADQLPVGFGHPQEARGLTTKQARCQNWPAATRCGRFLDQHVHRTM
jgi:hypothetical protein